MEGGRVQSCHFCEQSEPAYNPSRLVDTPLTQTDSFVSWASLGALVEGWVLALPRRHHLNLGELGSDEVRNFEEFCADLSRSVSSVYKSPVYEFEHGATFRGSAVGCSIDHAHLHLVPVSLDLRRLAVERAPSLLWESVDSVAEARMKCAPGESYLYLREPGGQRYAAHGKNIPSQFFRQLIAQELDLGEPFWRRDSRLTTSNNTVLRLLEATGRAHSGFVSLGT
ncbi:diadenosine tetraphosphate (Ap4A) HIT family hydrolase [Lentzea flaviverrucosa]|uniref:Diadenosine tetraphosphate (Ap4A) hydrolase n=1 Tax=Lentzea flaviverrucosa TaxID=200379 RepID=A0A1H9Q1P5_9PSEU|nr:diadenosine tetraphosphate (Ap4A) HIT family hydrolase [Lentzea flaviverrucosa]SER54360.1 Diadenosine tetraphosphate (Ap4A) hydrolase [Lentzea flaviverrucosa]